VYSLWVNVHNPEARWPFEKLEFGPFDSEGDARAYSERMRERYGITLLSCTLIRLLGRIPETEMSLRRPERS